ncbi:hypothetical protein SBV1_460051 [Verrucomicrobia bacterium]|nr:hypothetical protein SBV1_460051 [Verrucomicrobiota bacterium]
MRSETPSLVRNAAQLTSCVTWDEYGSPVRLLREQLQGKANQG